MNSAALRIAAGLFNSSIDAQLPSGRVDLESELIVPRGQIVGLYGRSGIGKSIFARGIVDLLLKANSRETGTTDIPQRLLFIPQDPPLFQECTLSHNAKILSGGSTFEQVLQSADKDLAEALSNRAHFSPRTLSGGERRLFTLTCILLRNADCLIIDETLVSMDPERLKKSLELLTEFAKSKNCGVLLITHDERVLRHCDLIYEMRLEENRRILRQVLNECTKTTPLFNNEDSNQSTSLISDVPPRPAVSIRRLILLRTSVGCAVALCFLIGLLVSPRLLRRPGIEHIFPTATNVWNESSRLSFDILDQGLWTLGNSILAWGISIFIVACFSYMTLSIPIARSTFLASWMSLQTVPVLVITPLFALVFNVHGMLLEIAIGVFISVFPLGLLVARSLSAVPLDFFRVYDARTAFEKFKVALHASWGNVVRAVVSCTPLSTIGIVVAEYLAGRHGLGHHLSINISAPKLTVPYIYTVSIVLVAICLFFMVSMISIYLLPKDVSPE